MSKMFGQLYNIGVKNMSEDEENLESKPVKLQLKILENELQDLQIAKAKKTLKRLKARTSYKNAHGEIVKQRVTDAAGRPVNRTKDDSD